MKRGFALTMLLSFWGATLFAQDFSEQSVSLSLRGTTLEEALYQLIDQHGIPLSFSNSLLPEKVLSAEIRRQPLPEVLDYLLDGTAIGYRQVGRQIVLYSRQYPVPRPLERFTLSGYVRDADSGEPLLTASVYDRASGQGTHTNAYGYFSLRLPRGEAQLEFSYLGYSPRRIRVDVADDQRMAIDLRTALVLQEVVVTAADRPAPLARSGYAAQSLRVADAERFPALGGEPDLVRTAQLLPGVQTGADGFGGMYVRGGESGHNLILLDGVPVYNLSHAAGLFSIFNTSMVQTADLVRGVAPARYGGRLASVLDVRTREGNNQRYSGRVDLGMVSARVLLEGPIVKGKSSFLVAARKSFLNWYLRPISRAYKARNGDWGSTSYGFYDLNAKLNYQVSDRDKLYLSVYSGDDRFANGGGADRRIVEPMLSSTGPRAFRYEQLSDEHLRWGNTIGSLRWNHDFGPRLFSTVSIHYSRLQVRAGYQTSDSLYRSETEELLGSSMDYGRYRSGMEDIGVQVDLEYKPVNTATLRFGGEAKHQVFQPGVLRYDESTAGLLSEATAPVTSATAREASLYLEADLDLGKAWHINGGLRASLLGTDGTQFLRWEPRLAARFQAGPTTSLQAAFGVQTQSVHLLSSANLGLPIDLWVPSTAEVAPEASTQWSLGVEQQLPLDLVLRVEGYYKTMDNLVAYADGAFFIDNWRDHITVGNGSARGLEFMLERRQGRLRGWIAYTLAQTERRFEEVNFGRPYPFRYDRRHDLKIALRYQLGQRLELTANWVYGSGLAYSLPEYQLTYDYPGVPDQPIDLYVFSERNQNRLPANHRLDLGVNLDLPGGKALRQQLSAGIYNVYNRQNPLFVDLRSRMQVDNGRLREGKELVQVTLAPVLPYLSYSVSF